MSTFLITGAAGFIASHLIPNLLKEGHSVIGIDNFDPFYGRDLKLKNLELFAQTKSFQFHENDIRNDNLYKNLGDQDLDCVIHLAALAGVQPSILRPLDYWNVNILGTQRLLTWISTKKVVPSLIFASSSSVYGNREQVPFRESDNVDFPISPYAATKKAGELMVHTYSHLYGVKAACLRFFTVFGPRQRPDLAIRKFTTHILNSNPIQIYGTGKTFRDYTYVEDMVDGITKAANFLNYQKEGYYDVFNLGSGRPITLLEMVKYIEVSLGKKAIVERLPDQPGDVFGTFADIQKAQKAFNYNPKTETQLAFQKTVSWIKEQFL